MAGLSPSAFAARLTAIRDRLTGLAQTAADDVLQGMQGIAETAVQHLVERTPRSAGEGPHIADGWTSRKVEAGPGVVMIEVVNTDPRAVENLRLADGSVTDYTLLEILEYGSERHDIVPVNAEFLAFRGSNGQMFYRKYVDHPGTDPYAMVSTTETEVALDIKKLIDATRRTLTLKRIGKI